MPELMGLSLLLGLLALMATAAVARGWLRAEEETCGRSAGKCGGRVGAACGALVPGLPVPTSGLGLLGCRRPLGLSFSSCEMSFASRDEMSPRRAGRVPSGGQVRTRVPHCCFPSEPQLLPRVASGTHVNSQACYTCSLFYENRGDGPSICKHPHWFPSMQEHISSTYDLSRLWGLFR